MITIAEFRSQESVLEYQPRRTWLSMCGGLVSYQLTCDYDNYALSEDTPCPWLGRYVRLAAKRLREISKGV